MVTNAGGETVASYTITVTNASGRGTAQEVAVADELPPGFTYASTASFTTGGGATRTATVEPAVGVTNPTWGTVTMPGASTVTITFTVAVAPSVAPGSYPDAAIAIYLDPQRATPTGQTSGGGTGPTAPVEVGAPVPSVPPTTTTPSTGAAPGTAASPPTVKPPKPSSTRVTLQKLLSERAVSPGGRLDYRLIVRNVGSSTAEKVQVCDRVPQRTTVVSRDHGRMAAGRICFAIASLAPGKTRSFAIVLRADSDAVSPIVNRATVTGANFPTANAQVAARVLASGSGGAPTRGFTG